MLYLSRATYEFVSKDFFFDWAIIFNIYNNHPDHPLKPHQVDFWSKLGRDFDNGLGLETYRE